MNNSIYEYRFLSFIIATLVYAVLIIYTPLLSNNVFYFSALLVAWAITLFSTYKYFWMIRGRK